MKEGGQRLGARSEMDQSLVFSLGQPGRARLLRAAPCSSRDFALFAEPRLLRQQGALLLYQFVTG
jgi:hypothetical protein